MKPISNLLFFICSLGLIQGCNTLYNSHVINMEVIVPGKIAFSPEYQKVAVRYHNCMDYIKILAQRKLDIKNINRLMNREISESNENKNE